MRNVEIKGRFDWLMKNDSEVKTKTLLVNCQRAAVNKIVDEMIAAGAVADDQRDKAIEKVKIVIRHHLAKIKSEIIVPKEFMELMAND